jgi:prepilin signal peptidase PulO-like enzyme (type II secretory pathway)
MTLLLAWIGAATASLLCLFVDRTLVGERLSTVHSRCVCGRELGILEVFPVFSWFALRGRARCCKAKLPWRWPAEEFLAGVAFYVGGHIDLVWGVALSVGALAVVGIIEIVAQPGDKEEASVLGLALAGSDEPRRSV